MVDFLLELLCEELPHKMQSMLRSKMPDIISAQSKKNSLIWKSLDIYTTPRRFAVLIHQLEIDQSSFSTEIKGPRADANHESIRGFIRSHGITENNLIIKDTSKGKFFFTKKAELKIDLQKQIHKTLISALNSFQCPKSMRWGANKYKWSRPVKNILCVLDGKIMDFEFLGVNSLNTTKGHKHFSKESTITINNPKNYVSIMEKNGVIVDSNSRISIIRSKIKKLEQENNFTVELQEDLLQEVASLVEYPFVYLGKIDMQFMSMPSSLLISVMKKHQKYFHVFDKTNLSPYFVCVANNRTDNILPGNEKVLRARLLDATFILESDLKNNIEYYLPKLKQILFHAQLGNMLEKTNRILILAKYIAVWIPQASIKNISESAQLCKADLTTNVVKEFPELAGIICSYYVKVSGGDKSIYETIEQHYMPIDAHSKCTHLPAAIAISIADKLDSLTGLMLIGEKAKGSKDPYGLRRHAIGIIRVILENSINIPINLIIKKSISLYSEKSVNTYIEDDIISFFFDRLQIVLLSEGIPHNVLRAVKKNDILFYIARDSRILLSFLHTSLGKVFIKSYKRAIRILDNEKSKKKLKVSIKVNTKVMLEKAEINLYDKIFMLENDIKSLLEQGFFIKAIELITLLNTPLENFMNSILINCHDDEIRENRLRILAYLKQTISTVADFDKIF